MMFARSGGSDNKIEIFLRGLKVLLGGASDVVGHGKADTFLPSVENVLFLDELDVLVRAFLFHATFLVEAIIWNVCPLTIASL